MLDAAQRFLLKGQLDKAIKEYLRVVALEPKEMRHRQKLAELLARDNRRDEAIAQYETAGRFYADNSYYLKAIAVFKQIQRLTPKDLQVSLTVAELNHKQGLIVNALSEYGQVVAQLEKQGRLHEAAGVLERMLEVERDNAAVRLKHAETLFVTGAKDASLRAFKGLLDLLAKHKETAAAQKVTDRIAELFPIQQGKSLDDVLPQLAFAEPTDLSTSPEPPPPETARTTAAQGAGKAATAPAEPFPGPWEEEIEFSLEEEPPLLAPEQDLELSLDLSLPADFEKSWGGGIGLPLAHMTQSPVLPEKAAPPEPKSPGDEEVLPLEEEELLDLLPDESAASGCADEGADRVEAVLELDDFGEFYELDEVEEIDDPALLADEGDVESPAAGEEYPVAGAPGPSLRDWDEIYPERKGDGDADPAELESQYDLGLGYLEMGMYVAAIAQFDLAARNPRRRLDCLTLQAICYRKMGELPEAEGLLRRGLDLKVLSPAERGCLNYELARLLEKRGESQEAVRLYREVNAVDPAFRDVSRRLYRLTGEEPHDVIDLELEEEG